MVQQFQHFKKERRGLWQQNDTNAKQKQINSFFMFFHPLTLKGLHRPRGVRLLQVFFCRCESFLLLYVFFLYTEIRGDANFVRPIEFIHDVSVACHQCNLVTSQHLSKLRLKHETCVRLMYNTQRLNELYLKYHVCLTTMFV